MHADGGITPAPDSGQTLAAAAEALGISKDAVRRRLRAGQLGGHQVDGPHGPTWCVHLDGAPGLRHGGDAPAHTPAPTVATPIEAAALVELVDRLTRENRDLAGQVGYFQARAQVLDERVRALEAPKEQSAPPAEPSFSRLNAWRLMLAIRALAALALVVLAVGAWVR
jgi:hypothetical protein